MPKNYCYNKWRNGGTSPPNKQTKHLLDNQQKKTNVKNTEEP